MIVWWLSILCYNPVNFIALKILLNYIQFLNNLLWPVFSYTSGIRHHNGKQNLAREKFPYSAQIALPSLSPYLDHAHYIPFARSHYLRSQRRRTRKNAFSLPPTSTISSLSPSFSLWPTLVLLHAKHVNFCVYFLIFSLLSASVAICFYCCSYHSLLLLLVLPPIGAFVFLYRMCGPLFSLWALLCFVWFHSYGVCWVLVPFLFFGPKLCKPFSIYDRQGVLMCVCVCSCACERFVWKLAQNTPQNRIQVPS